MKDDTRTAIAITLGLIGGTAAIGGLVWVTQSPKPEPLPSTSWQTYAGSYTEADVEAGARMLASENPTGSQRLHIEQVFTQLRSRAPGQSLFDRITAGSGFGSQAERKAPGGVRPVATDSNATDAQRELVRECLDGLHQSRLPGARKFFEPAQQDKALAVGIRAREKRARGEPLSAQEKRLIRYTKSADVTRRDWLRTSKLLDTIDGVEFFS